MTANSASNPSTPETTSAMMTRGGKLISGGVQDDAFDSMPVPMVEVGIVRMFVAQRHVHMPVRVWLTGRRPSVVLVSVMFVVPMEMVVLQRFVDVLMAVTFADVQPHA